MTATKVSTRIERKGHLQWVTVSDIEVSPLAQRDLRPGWAAQIAAEFDPDRLTPPLVSKRDGKYYVIDGQHRVEAMRLMGWGDQQVQCWVHDALSEAQEADLFLWHNQRKAVQAFDKFRIAVVAGREQETDIDRIVRAAGLKIASAKGDGGIGAVTSLERVYRHGPKVLARTLKIVRDAYGDAGMDGQIIQGVGLVCARYNGELDDNKAVARLGSARGGVGGLTSKANVLRKATNKPVPHCVAAAVVDTINAGKGGKKLPNWWAA